MLAALPLALLLASAFFIPQVKMGVDFKGGILVTLHSSQPFDAVALQAGLESGGIVVTSIKSMQSPAGGHSAELELVRSAALERADAIKSKFFEISPELSRLEIDSQYQNNTDSKEKYAVARKDANSLLNEMLTLAGNSTRAESLETADDLKLATVSAWQIVSDRERGALSAAIDNYAKYDTISMVEVTSNLSARFIEKAVMVVVWSTIFVTIVVFLIFRTLVPSLAVLVGAAADIAIALGAMGLFGIPLTLASFAALLMLVGFSLDTDVLLTMRVIKRREGRASDRAYEAMKTGMTMSLAAMVAFSSLFILAALTGIRVYYEISSVALAGLVGDLFATWGLNAVIVLHYAEGMEKKGGASLQKPLASFIFRD